MKTHELKILPEFFEAVDKGTKRFELRYNDRDFKQWDFLILKEWNPEEGKYTGREIKKRINYILAGYGGLEKGWVVLGIEDYIDAEFLRKHQLMLDILGTPYFFKL